MREMFERVMHAMGWMPVERERVLSERLQVALDEKAVAEQNAQTLRSNVARAESSWERAEARIRELESERRELIDLYGSIDGAKLAGLNRKTISIGARAEELLARV